MLDVPSLSAVHRDKKPKNDTLEVCPYVWTSSGIINSGMDATVPLDVIANAPGQPDWWYRSFDDPFAWEILLQILSQFRIALVDVEETLHRKSFWADVREYI